MIILVNASSDTESTSKANMLSSVVIKDGNFLKLYWNLSYIMIGQKSVNCKWIIVKEATGFLHSDIGRQFQESVQK